VCVSSVVVVVAGADAGDDGVGTVFVSDEQAARSAAATAVAAIEATKGWLRMWPIYARLADVLQRTLRQECCRA
jgi:hypothetical protein